MKYQNLFLNIYNFKQINTKHVDWIVWFDINIISRMPLYSLMVIINNSPIVKKCGVISPLSLLANDKSLTDNSQIGDIHNVW